MYIVLKQMMDFQNEVLAWFQKLDAAARITYMCNFFNCCSPLELQFIFTYLKGICYWECTLMKQAEEKANDSSYPNTWKNLEDAGTRSRLIISIPFVRYNNYFYAEAIYKFLSEKFPGEKWDWKKIFDDEAAMRQTELLITLAANHPAFKFYQKQYFNNLLGYLKQNEPKELDQEHRVDKHTPIKGNENSIRQPEESLSSLPKESSSCSSILKQTTNVASHEEPLSSHPSNENVSGVSQEEPCLSSQLSKENTHDVSQKQEIMSSNIGENINIVSQEESHLSCSHSRRNVYCVAEDESHLPSSPSAENINHELPEKIHSCHSFQEENVNDASSTESCSSGSASKETVNTVPKEQQPSSSPTKQNLNGMLQKKLPSSPTAENENMLQQETLLSSPSVKLSVVPKTSMDSAAASPIILKRPPVAGRSGKIRNIELKGNGKKGAYRIEVTWSSGKKTELFKTFKQLKIFQQKVDQLCSDLCLRNGVKKTTPTLPDLSTITSPDQKPVEQYDKVSIYLSDFVNVLPLPVRDHDLVVTFFQPPDCTPPRPILVGQGLHQAPFIEKINSTPDVQPFRNRNNGRHFTFHNRQFRNSTTSWTPPNSAPWNYPRFLGPPLNHSRHDGSFNHPKPPFRQGKWKSYPPISGSPAFCSSQNSPLESSQTSRSSPQPGNSTGTNNSLKGNKNFKNKSDQKESSFSETKPGQDETKQCLDNNRHSGKIVILNKK